MNTQTHYRTHTCGELREGNLDATVTLCGWVDSIRTFGKLQFIDLRDRYGLTQIVFKDDFSDTDTLKELRKESVVSITGTVVKRSQPNDELATGAIEVVASDMTLLTRSDVLPLDMDNVENNGEETRLKYRYLDLRRKEMQCNFQVRHKAMLAARNFLDKEQFLEIETPMLVRSTPEGARDFTVPSRIHNGSAYSLPQSPQLYKQILMVAGFDRYFQMARCLRDEDLRADRQPEFTQIDVEMSFVSQDDIFDVGERLCQKIFKDALDYDLNVPFRRISFAEAMEKYGTDKPDLRFGLELVDLTDIAAYSESDILSKAESVKCLVVPNECGKKEVEAYTKHVQIYRAKGLINLVYNKNNGSLEGPMAKFFDDLAREKIAKAIEPQVTEEQANYTLLIVAGKEKVVTESLGQLRNKVGKDLKLYDPKAFSFAWVVDFPSFEWDEEENKWAPAHHMFTMPKKETLHYLTTDPGKVVADCYDLTLNGIELASGSIRVHDSTIQKQIMDVIGIKEEDAYKKFGFLLDAFQFGAPPHGGFAIGFDRLVAMMSYVPDNDIREVIAFPKNKSGICPMDGSPSPMQQDVLDMLGIEIKQKTSTSNEKQE
jgi:aspartyl-tRNA synthetase